MYHFPYTILNMNDFQLSEPIDFDWDLNNEPKIFKKHGITRHEIEETFTNYKFAIPDESHSLAETRFGMYGQTDQGEILFIIFTIREPQVRVISARKTDKSERKIYEEAKENSEI